MSNFGFIIKNITGENPVEMPTSWSLLAIDIVREVNRIPRATLTLSDGDVATQAFPVSNNAFFNPGQTIQIAWQDLTAPLADPITVFTGLVVSQTWEANINQSILTIGLKHKAIKLTQSRKSLVTANTTDQTVIKAIIDRCQENPNQNGAALTALFPADPTAQDIVQYNCTDWDFMLTRAEVNDLLVAVKDDNIYLDKIALGNATQTYTYGLDGIYALEMEANASDQYFSVTSTAWDIANQVMNGPATATDTTTVYPGDLVSTAVAEGLGYVNYGLTSPAPLVTSELTSWGNATLLRSRLGLIRGRISLSGTTGVNLLDTISIKGVGQHFSCTTSNPDVDKTKVLVTGLRHRVTNQLGWVTDLQFGLSDEWFSSNPDIAPPPAAGLIPPVSGLQIGKVVALENEDFNNQNYQQSMLKIKVPALGVDTTIWARMAFPEAGNTRGFYAWPKTNDEVVLGYFNDDPRQPVILGSLYSSTNTPPLAPNTTNLVKGWVSQLGMYIKFDDTNRAVSIGTDNANITFTYNQPIQDSNNLPINNINIKYDNDNSILINNNGVTITCSKLTVNASGDGQNILLNGQLNNANQPIPPDNPPGNPPDNPSGNPPDNPPDDQQQQQQQPRNQQNWKKRKFPKRREQELPKRIKKTDPRYTGR